MGLIFRGRHQGFTGDSPTYFYCVDCKVGGSCPHLCVYTSVTGQVKIYEGVRRFYLSNGFLGLLGRSLCSFTIRHGVQLVNDEGREDAAHA